MAAQARPPRAPVKGALIVARAVEQNRKDGVLTQMGALANQEMKSVESLAREAEVQEGEDLGKKRRRERTAKGRRGQVEDQAGPGNRRRFPGHRMSFRVLRDRARRFIQVGS